MILRAAIAAVLGLALAGRSSPARAEGDTCLQARLANIVERHVQNGFRGAILVARGGKPLFRHAYGLANEEWAIANTPDTKFRAGSLMKQFTAIAIIQLAEQGRLSVEDLASRHYPQWPSAWGSVTIKQLLTHTSGIPLYSSRTDGTGGRAERTPEQIIALVRDKPSRFLPGSRWEYNNTGYVVLGLIVERLAGVSFPTYLKTHILSPARMDDSGYDDGSTILKRRAYGYEQTDQGLRTAPFLSMNYAYSSGALYTTADDLLKWDQALNTEKLVTAESKREIFKDQAFGYGYGWSISRQNSMLAARHSGHINGFSSFFTRYLDKGMTTIVLSNIHGSDMPEQITRDIEEVLAPGRDGPGCR